MAQRFYFDLTDGFTTIRDNEGVEAEDLADAVKQAEAALEEMRAAGELADFEEGWRLVIRTGADANLATIPIV
ncbi:DUF6894 family protein [Methylobacterium nodulans]|uniref:DUF6894 family protein n=1 Tax=Methylobacterium nodulans TaxID=114616 RepID=UPI0002FE33DD|nr:hypothetical protein [Methylobacterium nodulans]